LIESGRRLGLLLRAPKLFLLRDLAASGEEAGKKGQLGEELPFSVPRGGADYKLPDVD
jgi:hypothetical protein